MSGDRELRVALALAALEPCLLCGEPPAVTVLFVPDSGAPAVAYSLCEGCFARPDRMERAEAVIFGERAA